MLMKFSNNTHAVLILYTYSSLLILMKLSNNTHAVLILYIYSSLLMLMKFCNNTHAVHLMILMMFSFDTSAGSYLIKMQFPMVLKQFFFDAHVVLL